MRADAAEDSAVLEGRIAVTLTCARGLPEQPEVSESGECPLFTSWRAFWRNLTNRIHSQCITHLLDC